MLVASVDFLPDSEYVTKKPSLSEQSILSIDPRVVRATDELDKAIRLATNSVTDTVTHLISQASDKAERQFNRTVGDSQRSADGLSEAIKLTIVESINNALRE